MEYKNIKEKMKIEKEHNAFRETFCNDLSSEIVNDFKNLPLEQLENLTQEQIFDASLKAFNQSGAREKIFKRRILENFRNVSNHIFDQCDILEDSETSFTLCTSNTKTNPKGKTNLITIKLDIKEIKNNNKKLGSQDES